MSKFIQRQITPIIEAQKSKFPVLAITGPRQSGKTTLLKEIFSDYSYVSLENPNTRSFALDDPIGFLNRYDHKVILDEVQRVPALFSYIQGRVDESKIMGQYILSGSQNFHLLNNITQTLAGRVALFKLLPFDFTELKQSALLANSYAPASIKGFYPAIFDRDIDPVVFYANYIQTYLEKDVTELMNIRDLKQFRTFLGLCAGRAGQLLNFSALANECNISHNTAKAWLSILESSYIIFLLQPYHQNFNKRLVKTPKLYFYDTGLLNHLLGIRTAEELDENRLKGNIFENMILAEYQKQNHHLYLHKDYYFWQDSNAHEVDLLMKKAQGFSIFEIKATQTISNALFKEMDRFEETAAPEKVNKTLIYGGAENEKRTRYDVVSWQNVPDFMG
ncbi:ATP-binding protein [Mucilaginibacter ginsenosidivorax]|uniref:ATP-binding protein n=1 Tax=Mucilaginibacter ginsenosidivorax TaxID=862126 RepID=A0A5B8W2M6_9SPHI|nr:ATP-binding protein [Mucilaginibacter ginsenosidivorax]QEC78310.1 ATP-binding protein [Mucilaginibacter ginsenosidivorax]